MRKRGLLYKPVVYSTDRSKAVVQVLVLFFVALWFILRGYLFYVLPCVILFLCFFSPFSTAITSLGEERANLSAFRTFVRFALVWFCLFPLPRGVWEGLRLVIMALPGLSFYLFFVLNMRNYKFHSKYVIKQPPFTDGEQQTYRTGGEQTNRKDGKQQTPGRHRTGGEQQTQQSGGKQQTYRHQSFVFHHVRFNDVS